MTDFPTRTIKIKYDLLEDIILAFLYQNNLIKHKEMAMGIDLAVEVDEEENVEFDVIYEELPPERNVYDLA